MGPFSFFVFVYVLGGLTFLPLCIAAAFLYGYYTFPRVDLRESHSKDDDPRDLTRPEDVKVTLKSATDDLEEKFRRRHESDVAAGYFAVCREYVPGGVNGKPPARNTPAGDVVANESPSVYQSMYRSIFDRTQKPSIEPNKADGKLVKKANNIFYVILRHGHLMLYDDAEQLEVRYVISLEHHDVDIYAEGEDIPEGDLWIKRNAIRLLRKSLPYNEQASSLPFYMFSENQSEKEDFYFALIKNQEKVLESDGYPIPLKYDVQHVVKLVQQLHSTEEHLQTRWLNALIGRLFLAMYRTNEMEDYIRKKITKKISRVKKPAFITRLALEKIDLGDGAPFITNPRLQDLTMDGDCVVEADISYGGRFRVEIAATARIELGSRFKAREVDMVLAVVLKGLDGHGLIKFKPPPSNRIWFAFMKMPKIEMSVEPIVSSRQITYNIILRQIENRIKEVVAETVVLPNWEDVAFLDTFEEKFRGGIWKKEKKEQKPVDIPDEQAEDEAGAGGASLSGTSTPLHGGDERVMSMPSLHQASAKTVRSRTGVQLPRSVDDTSLSQGVSSAFEKRTIERPRALRSSSFATAADPKLTTDHDEQEPATTPNPTSKRDSAMDILKNISGRSSHGSPIDSPAASPPTEAALIAALSAKQRRDTASSRASAESLSTTATAHTRKDSLKDSDLSHAQSTTATTPSTLSFDSRASTVNDEFKKTDTRSLGRSFFNAEKRPAFGNNMSATAAAAKDWGWGVLQRNKQKVAESGPKQGTPENPIGRGHPLPPPGIPLPPPVRSPQQAHKPVSRKSVPPPLLPKRPDIILPDEDDPSSRPPLPERSPLKSSSSSVQEPEDDLLVVEAPEESAPNSPSNAEHHDDFFGHSEDTGDLSSSTATVRKQQPKLPKRPSFTSDQLQAAAQKKMD